MPTVSLIVCCASLRKECQISVLFAGFRELEEHFIASLNSFAPAVIINATGNSTTDATVTSAICGDNSEQDCEPPCVYTPAVEGHVGWCSDAVGTLTREFVIQRVRDNLGFLGWLCTLANAGVFLEIFSFVYLMLHREPSDANEILEADNQAQATAGGVDGTDQSHGDTLTSKDKTFKDWCKDNNHKEYSHGMVIDWESKPSTQLAMVRGQ